MQLISSLLDGSISDADFDRLHIMLEDDPELRRVYMQSVDQDVELSFRPPDASNVIVFPFRWFPRPALAAAAILAIAALILFLLLNKNPSGPDSLDPSTPVAVNPPPTPETPTVQPDPPSPSPPPPAPAPPRTPPTRPVPSTPDSWAVDFESGLPTGWDAEFASADLPRGSRGAVRTITKTSDESGNTVTYRNITPPMAWGTGHFTVREDTHLHMIFKLEKTGHFDIFMLTHSRDPGRTDTMLYKFDNGQLWSSEGKWQKTSIPLAHFQGKNSDIGNFVDNLPPMDGEVAWQLFISAANNDLQMVIDEIRVDRSGSGEFVIEPLE